MASDLSPDNSTGNTGMQDQRMALQWIQDNIGAFHGDKDRVMIFGESSGAGCVSNHMVMPRSQGMFSRAAMESGAFGAWQSKPLGAAQDQYTALLNLTGCAGGAPPDGNGVTSQAMRNISGELSCLQKLDLTVILRHADKAGAFSDSLDSSRYAPVIDGTELPDVPLTMLEKGDVLSKVPVLMGANRDEGRMFLSKTPTMWPPVPPPAGKISHHHHHSEGGGGGGYGYGNGSDYRPKVFDDDAFVKWLATNFGPSAATWGQLNASVASLSTVAMLLAEYSHSPSGSTRGPWYSAANMMTDYFMACPTRRAARLLSADPKRGNNATFMYHFVENPADLAVSGGGGACHSCEIPFVFNAAMFLEGAPERELATSMARYWVEFAATGNPAQGGAGSHSPVVSTQAPPTIP